jgi:hypothetical protein
MPVISFVRSEAQQILFGLEIPFAKARLILL